MPDDGRLTVVRWLWFRLSGLLILCGVFSIGIDLSSGKAIGWTFYLTGSEVAFEVAVRMAVAALAALIVSSVVSLLVGAVIRLPLGVPSMSVVRVIYRVLAIVALFLTFRLALRALINQLIHGWHGTALLAIFTAIVVLGLAIPRFRRRLLDRIDSIIDDHDARRVVAVALVAVAVIVGAKVLSGEFVTPARATPVASRPHSNILLITFDALSAEDMSLYGYALPTTPNIDDFARQATVFTNYYSVSTFTTPTVAAMLTGRYPSESRIFHLQGHARDNLVVENLPRQMQSGNFTTGAFLSNPFAYYFARSLRDSFDHLPAPAYNPGGLDRLWRAVGPANDRFGGQIDEYVALEHEWNELYGLPANLSMRMRPGTSFDQAQELIAQMPDGFFAWIHVITPHSPYLPDARDKGKFLPPTMLRTLEKESDEHWKPYYSPSVQNQVNQYRLRYDEFILGADRAFGDFINALKSSGKLDRTTVIVSADHGDSFEGGVYQHSSPYLTRPVIHVPLIVKTPGQQQGTRVDHVADQTSLAPTILQLAGIDKPKYMTGGSLAGWLDPNRQQDASAVDKGRAFCQYFERNSEFKPLTHGTIGIIQDGYQYFLDVGTQKGSLRPLGEAQFWNLDRAAEHPDETRLLRAALHSRFPDLVRPQ